MTDKSDIKKLTKLKERVYDLLEKNRFNDETKVEPTHQSYGLFRGVFVLDRLQRKEFMELYTKAIVGGVKDFSILERQKDFAPIIVDVDLELPSEEYKSGARLYNNKLVLNIIKKYVEAINTYLDVPPEGQFRICLFEKPKPQEKEGVFKDGFHIMFPDLCVHTKMRHLIRYKVVKMCDEDGTFEGFLNGPEKIIDKAVVSSNGWFLYGSTKPNGQLYTLSYIYDIELNKIYDHINKLGYNTETGDEYEYEIDIKTIIDFLSLQSTKSYSKSKATPIKDEYAESDIDAECEKLGINSMVKAEDVKYDVPVSKEDEVRRACKYTSMLCDKRASDYHDWMHVGLALHNVDTSLLGAWVEFSKKCGKKFKEGECEKVWKTMKNPSNGNVLTIRSLAYWAKQDDPKLFESFVKEEFKNMMKKSLDGNTYFLAKSVHAKYADRFVCSSITKNIWWEFKNHRWNRVQDGYTLKILLSEDFANEYNREIAEISLKLTQVGGIEKEELQARRTRIDKIVEKLMNTNFKETLVKECKNLFYDDKFEQKLDSNLQLIGFENGIFDLEKGIFREGRPDDYVTMSTKNDYHKWSDKNPYNVQINKFFEQVFPNAKVRKYFLTVLSTCVSGETKEEKFYIMTGSGSNGKSLTNDLMSKSLGDYYMSCDISLITRKRGQSNQAAPEKVRMKGRRCGVFQEADEGEKMNVGLVKEMTGGDIMLMRDLFKGSDEMIEFKPQMKYFLTANQLPDVPSTDDGTWRRLRVIEFISKFTNNPTKQNEFMIDTTLKQKIEQWAPTFASYLIHMFLNEYRSNNYLVEPQEVMASTNQYKLENDYLTEYFMDRLSITTNPKDTIGSNTLWEDFKVWYKTTYDSKSMPKRPEFLKFMTKQLGNPAKKGFANVVFNTNEDSDGEAPTNELDV
jgi:P4 family phage/plasmid primase-like protien